MMSPITPPASSNPPARRAITAGASSPPDGAPGVWIAASRAASASSDAGASVAESLPSPARTGSWESPGFDSAVAPSVPAACRPVPAGCSSVPPALAPEATIPAPNSGAVPGGAPALPPEGSASRRALSNGIAYSLPVGEPGSTKTPSSCATAAGASHEIPARATSKASRARGTRQAWRKARERQPGWSAYRSIERRSWILGERKQGRVARVQPVRSAVELTCVAEVARPDREVAQQRPCHESRRLFLGRLLEGGTSGRGSVEPCQRGGLDVVALHGLGIEPQRAVGVPKGIGRARRQRVLGRGAEVLRQALPAEAHAGDGQTDRDNRHDERTVPSGARGYVCRVRHVPGTGEQDGGDKRQPRHAWKQVDPVDAGMNGPACHRADAGDGEQRPRRRARRGARRSPSAPRETGHRNAQQHGADEPQLAQHLQLDAMRLAHVLGGRSLEEVRAVVTSRAETGHGMVLPGAPGDPPVVVTRARARHEPRGRRHRSGRALRFDAEPHERRVLLVPRAPDLPLLDRGGAEQRDSRCDENPDRHRPRLPVDPRRARSELAGDGPRDRDDRSG